MPAKKKPAYLYHKATGQARVRIDGKDHYLGQHGSDESHARYDDLVAAWVRKQNVGRFSLTVDDLVLLYLDHATAYYTKDGAATSEIHAIRAACRPLVKLFGRTRARDFGPAKLKQVRDEMVLIGWVRKSVNAQTHRLKRIIRWAVENEHLPPDVLTAVGAVPGLRKGRTTAPDRPPVAPVDDATMQATLPYLAPIVADMARLQRLTGCRPAEVCMLRPCDLDRSGEVWTYSPESHKTQHHGRERQIFIGPKGQSILLPYLLRDANAPCFSPAEAEQKRREAAHELRVTPISYGNKPGSNRKPKPARPAGEAYTSNSYRRAIERAADLADEQAHVDAPEVAAEVRIIPRWAPNQLRHAAASTLR